MSRLRLANAKLATNVSLSWELLTAAREAGLNLSALLERALTNELTVLKRRGWRAANAPAIAAYNAHLKNYGPFCATRRTF